MKTKAGILRLEQVAWLPLLPYLTYAPGNPVGFLGRGIHTDTMLLSTVRERRVSVGVYKIAHPNLPSSSSPPAT